MPKFECGKFQAKLGGTVPTSDLTQKTHGFLLGIWAFVHAGARECQAEHRDFG